MKRLALGEALHFPTEFVKRIFTEGGAVASSFVQITFTEQQLDLLRRRAQAAGKDVTSLVSEYLAKTDSTNLAPRHIRMGPGVGSQPPPSLDDAGLGESRARFRFDPVSGKAIAMRRGEVLRIRQLSGGQCVDFNAFNL